MAWNNAPSEQHFAAHYPLVLERAGLNDADYLTQSSFEDNIRAIVNSYWAARNQPTLTEIRQALDNYVTGRAMVRKAMQLLDTIHSEIALAQQLHNIPAKDRETTIEEYMMFRGLTDHLTKEELTDQGYDPEPLPDLDSLMEKRDRGIDFLRANPDLLARLLHRQLGDFRKEIETALVIEPALDLLDTIEFTPSRKLTRKAFFEALFDLVRIERNRRPRHDHISVVIDNRKKKSGREQT